MFVRAIVILVVFAVGCSEKKATQTKKQKPSPQLPNAQLPPGHQGMPAGHPGMPSGHPGGTVPPNHPPMGDGVDVTKLGLESPDPNRKLDPNKRLIGTITATEAVRPYVKMNDVIFVSVKRKDPKTGQPVGMPLGAKRLSFQGWPIALEVTEADSMIKGTDFSGDVIITVWKDNDSDVISKEPGEPVGQIEATIPSTKLEVKLDKLRGK